MMTRMPKFDNSIKQELNVTPVSNAAQTATASRKRGRGSRRADSDSLANRRDEQDPVKRKRLADTFYRRRSRNKAQDAEINAQNEAFTETFTENALEMQRGEATMEQDTQPNEG